MRPGSGAVTVTVQRRKGSGSFTTIKTLSTNAAGYFSFTTTVSGTSSYRFRYVQDGKTHTSGTQTVRPS